MASSSKYQMFKLLGNEFTFDVDVSKLGCGLNGALYFVSMDADGGMSKYSTNKAGAKYGTGYCDAQCPRDLKFINGEGNIEGWNPSSNDQNAGMGNYGSCCSEMDIWEANSISTAYTPHPCTTVGQHRCEGDSCGGTYSSDRYGGTCDPDGCDFNSYRQGVKDFYGPGMTVDTTKKFTVVTQFIAKGNSLSEIKRYYVQGGKVIPNSESTIEGNPGNSLTPEFCKSQKTAFGDKDVFNDKGGFDQFSKAVAGDMVLVMSLWDDHSVNMLWLDSTFPTDGSPDDPGKGRGSCDTSSGVPSEIETSQASNQVIYSYVAPLPFVLPGSETNMSWQEHPLRSHQLDLHQQIDGFRPVGEGGRSSSHPHPRMPPSRFDKASLVTVKFLHPPPVSRLRSLQQILCPRISQISVCSI